MSQFPDSGQRRDYGTMSGSSEQLGADTESLCFAVGNSIERIKQNTNAIEKTLKGIGTQRDNVQFRESACDIQKQTNEIIAATTESLGKLTRITRGETKQRRLQVDKYTSDFEYLVQKYSDGQQKLVTKMRRTVLVAEPQPEQDNEPSSNLNDQLMQQQQLQYQIQLSDARNRENQMREIESVVLDVNAVMLKLSEQITAQGQNISTIESNIENVQGNVEQGASELQKAQNYANKYRKKVLILLLIAIIAGAIVTGIVISSVGKDN